MRKEQLVPLETEVLEAMLIIAYQNTVRFVNRCNSGQARKFARHATMIAEELSRRNSSWKNQ